MSGTALLLIGAATVVAVLVLAFASQARRRSAHPGAVRRRSHDTRGTFDGGVHSAAWTDGGGCSAGGHDGGGGFGGGDGGGGGSC